MDLVISDDDSEPAKENDLARCLNQLEISTKILRIVIDDEEILCDNELLIKECKYFDAFSHFEKTNEINLKGGISLSTCKTILDFLNGEELQIDLNNFQDVLQASLFLQCGKVEDVAVNFISTRLSRDNVFRFHSFALSIGSQRLVKTTKFYIEKVFGIILKHIDPSGNVEHFLDCSLQQLEEMLKSDIQTSEDLLLFCVLAWVEQLVSARSAHAHSLLSLVNWRLLSNDTLVLLEEEGEELLKEQNHSLQQGKLKEAANYHKLRLETRVDFWKEHPEQAERRWPKMIVAVTTGSSHAGLQYLDLSRAAPMWRHLAKKPQDLRIRNSVTMVYSHPKLHFLGGEQRWQQTTFDLEQNKWGVARGVPPARLLAGAALLGDNIYLVGGVHVEDWGGTQGSAGQVVTSTSVDRYLVSEGRWEGVTPLEEARSSPGTAVIGGCLYVLGGLRKREMVDSVCRYDPVLETWDSLPPLPQSCVYFTLLVRGTCLWLIGGLNKDYKARRSSLILDTSTLEWREGPLLRQARQGAGGWVYNNRLYVCGGAGDNLKYIDSIEVLDEKKGLWEPAKIAVKTWSSSIICAGTRQPLRFFNQK